MKKTLGKILVILGLIFIMSPFIQLAIDKINIKRNVVKWDNKIKYNYEDKTRNNKPNLKLNIYKKNNDIKNSNSENKKSKNVIKREMKKENIKNETIKNKIENGDIIGKIIVSRTKEEIPILNGATKKNLKYGAALYDNGIYPGDNGTSIILGHRETTFYFLENVNKNNEIEIQIFNKTYKFKLKKTYIVKPDSSIILKQENYPGVTLDTCYPFHYFGSAPYRFVAKFELEKS